MRSHGGNKGKATGVIHTGYVQTGRRLLAKYQQEFLTLVVDTDDVDLADVGFWG